MENSVIDLIIRIKNGYLAQRERIESPYSQFREKVLEKLKSLSYIKNFSVDKGVQKTIRIELLYPDQKPAITDVQLFSKPGRRFYVSYSHLKPVLGGLGYSLLSTPKGILTNSEARKAKVGGELLFSIW